MSHFFRFLANALLCGSLITNPVLAGQATLPAVEDYTSGRVRIEKIMVNDETGVTAYNKEHTKSAQTLNLTNDLNIPAIGQFFGCKTIIGTSFLTEALKNPVSPDDQDTIRRRSQAIYALSKNSSLRTEIGTLLAQAQEEEQDLIKLMSEFFIGKTCPELAQLEALKNQNPVAYAWVNWLTTNPTGKTIQTAMNGFTLVSGIGGTALGGYALYHGEERGRWAVMTAYCALVTALGAYTNYKDYSAALEKRSKMHALNQLIHIAERFEQLCDAAHLEPQFAVSDIKKGTAAELLRGLKHTRYEDKKLYLFNTPAVHTFLYQVYQQEKYLAQIFACIAEIDAYHAIATNMVASRTTNNKFCFAEVMQDSKPTIHAHGFWNVLVPHAVPNSLEINQNIILTGPNAGGKSTAIRAILQNVVLAQTFGIAAADRFVYTPFDIIHSYLNISDDLINGLSLFASEVKRAQDILGTIRTKEDGQKFFFALDELFTGTVSEDGEECAFRFGSKLGTFYGVLLVYATHFGKLKELGNVHPAYANYKVDAPSKNSLGQLKYPFTLSKGASDVRVGLDIAQAAGLFE